MSGTKDKKPQGAPAEKEVAKVSCLEAYSLEEITEALGTIEEATVAFKVAEKRKNAAAELASEAEELAKAEEGKVRSAAATATYSKAQAEILKNQRVVAEEKALKEQRDADELLEAEVQESKRLAMQKEADAEKEVAAKARRDAGEYEPLKGFTAHGVFYEKSAVDLGVAGVEVCIIPLDKEGGKQVSPAIFYPVPLVTPRNGILKRSKR